jgi:hypothetical protein
MTTNRKHTPQGDKPDALHRTVCSEPPGFNALMVQALTKFGLHPERMPVADEDPEPPLKSVTPPLPAGFWDLVRAEVKEGGAVLAPPELGPRSDV